MALISPILDDRSYAELREQLLRRIPVYTPEWTDHNESDPGIALLELFAYLGESVLFRFNQIPQTTKIEFLRLLGVRPRPAVPATALLAASTELPAGVPIPAGTEVRAGSVVFATTGATQVWPLDVVAVGKTPAPPAAAGDRAEADRRADALARAGLSDLDPAAFYATTAVPADPLAADAVPLDVDRTLDHSLWIAVLRRKATDPTLLGDRSLFLGVAFDEEVRRPFTLQALDAAGADRFGSPDLTADPPPMLWRLWNGVGAGLTPLDVGDDTTRGLVTTGTVEVLLPQRLPALDPAVVSPGDTDNPPPLDDADQARVIAWLQVSRPRTDHLNDGIPPVRWVGVNAVRAEHARTAKPELLGSGTGDADQAYPLAQHPVLAGTTRLQVEESGAWQDWTEVDTYVVSGADDRHYTVDHEAGVVHFGGSKVPQLGERIRVRSYRYGGGLAGNVAAGALSAVSAGGVKIANPLPAAGGADAAALTEALDAIPAEVHRRDRAVVAEDFRELALQVTGVKPGRDPAAAAPGHARGAGGRRGQRRRLPHRGPHRPAARRCPDWACCAGSPATSTSAGWSPPSSTSSRRRTARCWSRSGWRCAPATRSTRCAAGWTPSSASTWPRCRRWARTGRAGRSGARCGSPSWRRSPCRSRASST